MAPTSTQWDCGFNTLRREHLFRNPPTDRTAYPALQAAVEPHISSFNRLFAEDDYAARRPPATQRGLIALGIEDIGYKTFLDGRNDGEARVRNRLTIRVKSVTLAKPEVPPGNRWAKRREIFPADARERHGTYRGRLTAEYEYRINDGDAMVFTRDLGLIPIMVKSNKCHLEGNSPALLVQRKEESEELGGYFIVNGNEKIIRLLQMNRRNFPMAIVRTSFQKRGAGYTPYGITIRSVRPDETSQSNVLHYLEDGNVTFRFSWRKNEYLIPVVMILKALVETNDREIFESVIGPHGSGSASLDNSFLTGRVEMLLRTYKRYVLYSRTETRAYLGNKFRAVLGVSDVLSDHDVGTEFLRRVVLPHLGNVDVTEQQDYDKYQLVVFMIRKLYALVAGDCAVDNPDALQNQEVLLGGFLYGMIVKERLEELVSDKLRLAFRQYFERAPHVRFTSEEFAADFPSKIFTKMSEGVGTALEYFMSTGNLASPTGLDLQQVAGFTVVAEKLNFLRFISHFRMVHRGAFFAELKTTTVRKLLPESWGFMCPVHTPDGAPCGLLNHLAHKCRILTSALDVSAIAGQAAELGVVQRSSASTEENVVVMLDGRILGWCSPKESRRIADCFRWWKVEGSHGVPLELEIGYVPESRGGSYPGIYMSSRPARMVRPVRYLPLDKDDVVGPFEQPYMSIAVVEDEIGASGKTTHVEQTPTNILSILANMTPFSDFNQSPRNMYQCQMGKQTMGTPATALRHRTDNKMYRIQTGQTPVVRPPLHNDYGFDNFPNGMNAIVAVISYTGYDMDDAMIMNKSSHERGFGYGTVYKTKQISLRGDGRKRSRQIEKLFGFAPGGEVKGEARETVDDDGLPRVGARVVEGSPLCAWHAVSADYNQNLNNLDGITHYEKYKDSEVAFIEEVRMIGGEGGDEPLQMLSIKLRIPRGPVIGDKFSSRHGQKGVLSQKWPTVDMPFTESGMQPDIIINPHAFPSRMTIGMFVESLAGKAGALHGLAQDSTPFKFDEQNTAGDYFGHQLMKAGYNYHGNEPMYSGITGEELSADIYIGVVYYQRLRHMVNDKYQVRTTGPVVPTTGQPVKGRKRGGGIRVGEMERDALLAHGTSFLVQDRLLNCSDYTRAWVCRTCGSFLSSQPIVSPWDSERSVKLLDRMTVRCRYCARRVDDMTAAEKASLKEDDVWHDGQGVRFTRGRDTAIVAVPGALRYLDVELAAMGVKMRYKLKPADVGKGSVENPVTVVKQAEEAEWLLEQQVLKEEELAKRLAAENEAAAAEGAKHEDGEGPAGSGKDKEKTEGEEQTSSSSASSLEEETSSEEDEDEDEENGQGEEAKGAMDVDV